MMKMAAIEVARGKSQPVLVVEGFLLVRFRWQFLGGFLVDFR